MDVKEEQPSWLELERVLLMPKVVGLTSLSEDTLERHHSDKIVHLSPRRRGMTVRNVLAIVNGK